MSVNAMVATLTRRRKELGYSQREVDEMMGGSPCQIGKWESQKRYPTADSLERWAKALGFDLRLLAPNRKKRER